ncbi:MAG: cob(I)yrinic acid a,c-diamide adenosyltransferase, partial [Myxococcota bacterium]
VAAYGAVDELNSALGLAAAHSAESDVQALCREIQARLLDLGAYLAAPDAERRQKSGIEAPPEADIEALERAIDGFEAELEPLRRFVLPGGTQAAAAFHVARTVCRRAERAAVALDAEDTLAPEALGYLNRLSDLLFVLARVSNRRAGTPDVEWRRRGA